MTSLLYEIPQFCICRDKIENERQRDTGPLPLETKNYIILPCLRVRRECNEIKIEAHCRFSNKIKRRYGTEIIDNFSEIQDNVVRVTHFPLCCELQNACAFRFEIAPVLCQRFSWTSCNTLSFIIPSLFLTQIYYNPMPLLNFLSDPIYKIYIDTIAEVCRAFGLPLELIYEIFARVYVVQVQSFFGKEKFVPFLTITPTFF